MIWIVFSDHNGTSWIIIKKSEKINTSPHRNLKKLSLYQREKQMQIISRKMIIKSHISKVLGYCSGSTQQRIHGPHCLNQLKEKTKPS